MGTAAEQASMASTVDLSLEQAKQDQPNPHNASQDLGVNSTAQHEHSDSMVTIRLSDNQHAIDLNSEAIKAVADAESIDPLAGKVEIAEPTISDTKQQDNLNLPERPQDQGMAKSSSIRASRVRFNMDESVQDALVSKDSNMVFEVEEDLQRRSQTSSKSSSSQAIIEDTDSVVEETTSGAVRTRSQSSSSEDSGSVHVDWDELDKNEELEQRDDATDEVSSVHSQFATSS